MTELQSKFQKANFNQKWTPDGRTDGRTVRPIDRYTERQRHIHNPEYGKIRHWSSQDCCYFAILWSNKASVQSGMLIPYNAILW